jgi:ubiquinone/menaquinone biosynthesis C-methylase UbiE
MQRVPEPEIMDAPAQALAYARADFSEPHQHFVELFRERLGETPPTAVLDLGCGPGDICRRFARAFPDCRIHGVDASAPMLALARSGALEARLEDRVDFFQGYLPGAQLPQTTYEVIMSNSLLHHLRDPATLWDSVRRFGGPGTRVFVMDLLRPASASRAGELVDRYAAGEPQVLRHDFYHSLCAAYTPTEVAGQLASRALDGLAVEPVSDRHFIVWGRL